MCIIKAESGHLFVAFCKHNIQTKLLLSGLTVHAPCLRQYRPIHTHPAHTYRTLNGPRRQLTVRMERGLD